MVEVETKELCSVYVINAGALCMLMPDMLCCVCGLICLIVYHDFEIGPHALPHEVILRLHDEICVPYDPFLAVIWSITESFPD